VEAHVSAEPVGAVLLKGFVKPVRAYRIVEVEAGRADRSCPRDPRLDV